MSSEQSKPPGPTPRIADQGLQDRIVANVQRGLPKSTAAELEGLTRNWLAATEARGAAYLDEHDGDPRDDHAAKFCVRLRKARAEYEASLLAKVNAAIDDPKAYDSKLLKWTLGVRNPAEWLHQPQAPAGPSDASPFGDVDLADVKASLAAKLRSYLAKTEGLES